MLAVALLALVVTAVSATWSAALGGWKRSRGMTESFQRERVVLGALSELTRSIIFYRTAAGLYDLQGVPNSRTGDSISFVTASDLLLPSAEALAGALRRVTLSLEQDPDGRSFLAIRNQMALTSADATEPVAPHVLSADVSGFSVWYRHPQTGEWQDNWEEKSLVPSVIEFRVTFGGGGDGREPPVVATRTVELPTAAYVAQTGGVGPSGTINMGARPPARRGPDGNSSNRRSRGGMP